MLRFAQQRSKFECVAHGLFFSVVTSGISIWQSMPCASQPLLPQTQSAVETAPSREAEMQKRGSPLSRAVLSTIQLLSAAHVEPTDVVFQARQIRAGVVHVSASTTAANASGGRHYPVEVECETRMRDGRVRARWLSKRRGLSDRSPGSADHTRQPSRLDPRAARWRAAGIAAEWYLRTRISRAAFMIDVQESDGLYAVTLSDYPVEPEGDQIVLVSRDFVLREVVPSWANRSLDGVPVPGESP